MKKKPRFQRRAPEGYITVNRALEILGCTHSTLYRIMNQGAFAADESIRFLGKRIFKEEAVKGFFDKHVKSSAAQ